MIAALLALMSTGAPHPGAAGPAPDVPGSRPSLTFILGEDEDPARPMFALAAEHFRRDPRERTGDVLEGARSLAEVRDQLARRPRAGGKPWGVVNLVVHGNASGYLDVDLEPGGPKVGSASLRRLPAPLPEGVVDGTTEIRLHGCAAGRDPALLEHLARWFGGGSRVRPVVRASLWYTAFRAPSAAGGLPTRSLCEWWDVVYRDGERPAVSDLVRRHLRTAVRHGLDPVEALAQRASARPGGAFSYEAPVRFTWTVVFPDTLPPTLPPDLLAAQWLPAQEVLQARLRAAGLAYHQLRWTVKPGGRNVHGIDRPALVATGDGRVLHVLRPLVRHNSSPGPEPQDAWDDPRYYATAR